VTRALAQAGDRAFGAVAASDAFFPFPDGVELLAGAGVVGIVAPGGSKRDAEVLAAAERLSLSFVRANHRHFKH
jgi:phosphoribosylaminoimidazolecarboxamide formyltransferase/IMP cyclohydrolase